MGNVLVFKNADFSANAINAINLMDQLMSCTEGKQPGLGYSGAYYVDMPIQRNCIVHELVLRRTYSIERCRYGTLLLIGRFGESQATQIQIPHLDLSIDEYTEQYIKLPVPLELHSGDYIGFLYDTGRVINPNATAGDTDVAYAISAEEEPSEFAGKLLVGSKFYEGTKEYVSNTYFGYIKMYGFYK